MIAVERANNRGVGLMEMFDYEGAVKAFEEALSFDPDWLPGQINVGIALLNTRKPADFERAIDLYGKILKKDPLNPYAHFCLGVIFEYQNRFDEARTHFEKVTEIDPSDAHAWYNLGFSSPDNPEVQRQCYEKALQCDPYLRRALNGLQLLLREDNPKRANELLATFEGLNRLADFEKQRYGEMGHYAEVIGRYPEPHPAIGPVPPFGPSTRFQVKLAAGTRWAKPDDFSKEGVADEVRRAVRKRFGATLVVLDYNRDGKPDLFLLGAVVENGKIRDLLLRNEGDSVFTDITHEAGLAEPRLSLGCTVGDFDNDGYPDLFITGIGRQWLFRNKGKGSAFEDVTKQAGLDSIQGVCLGSCFVDLDQDGDLDLVVARYAQTAEEAKSLLTHGQSATKTKGGFGIWLNVGEAPPHAPSEDPPPLTPAFKPFQAPALLPDAAAVAVAATDLERRGALDLILLADDTPAAALFNDRLLRFRRAPLPGGLAPAGSWNGALVLNVQHKNSSDLLLIGPDHPPFFLVNRSAAAQRKNVDALFEKGQVHSPPLLQAHAIDLDLDGWTDVVGLSQDGLPVLLENQGGKLAYIPEGFGPDSAWPKDIVAVAVGNFSGDKRADLLVWSAATGLMLQRNGGNGNQALLLELSGHRRAEMSGSTVRTNADGFGVRVTAQTEDFWTGAEATTLSAGLSQSRQPLVLGLGKHTQAEVVRLRWPDNCWQAELNKPAWQVVRIEETNRKPDSCPALFTWDGQRYAFVTDFLGGSALGEALPQGDGTCRQPRPEESVKIEAHQLVPRDGHYVLKIAEPMNEITYLDHLQLVVVDHPADVRVYPDERLVGSGPPPTQELLAFTGGKEIFPVQGQDQRGRDVTRTLRHWDRDTVADFPRRRWVGLAEEHWVQLDFGDRLSRFGDKEPLFLFLAGWADYPFPDSEWAAYQAGVVLQPPILERLGADGKWSTIYEDAGFPAGLPRMITMDVTGKLTGPRCVLRLRTNMMVFWDQIFVAPISRQASGLFCTKTLEVAAATLAERGSLQEYSPDGREPTLYDYHRLENVAVTRQAGFLTRLGEVTELLQARDDRFVILGPGDEVTVHFDARGLPVLPPSWTRSFVLRTHGYVKACGPLVVTGDTIEPLPFQRMSCFPYGPGDSYPQTLQEYRRQYNTRQVGPRSR
jgi:hypothetical protein